MCLKIESKQYNQKLFKIRLKKRVFVFFVYSLVGFAFFHYNNFSFNIKNIYNLLGDEVN